ncbi:hypothetical protein ACFL3E_01380 [Patescibacteria group bacterium]
MHNLKEKIDNATNIAIVIPENASNETVLAAIALKKATNGKGFIVGGEKILAEWGGVFEEASSQPKDFTISLDTKKYPIEELRYEKNDDTLTILLTTKENIHEKHLVFNTILPQSDFAVAVGFQNNEEKTNALKGLSKNQEEYECITLEGRETGKADQQAIKLLGRIILRSREEKEIKTLWSFISHEDFAKTGSSSAEIPKLMESLNCITQLPIFTSILWQDIPTAKVNGLVFSHDKNHISTLANKIGRQLIENHIMLHPYNNFTEAEISLRKLLRESL